MTRVLVLGAAGMLGHKVCQVFGPRFEVYATIREDADSFTAPELVDTGKLRAGVDALRFHSVAGVMEELGPDIVVNCIGIIKQLPQARDPVAAIEVNSVFPHRLARLCEDAGARLLHLSTDCVFSGRKGRYTEEETPDPVDLYGRSKLLGEVSGGGSLTVRTSIVGRELRTQAGLLEWFLSQDGKGVQGYVNAIFSGFTTLALARVLADIVADHVDLSGLYHVSAGAISKYDLLGKFREAFGLRVEIDPYREYHCDRTLDSSRFRAATGFVPPSWNQMVRELVEDDALYGRWRQDAPV